MLTISKRRQEDKVFLKNKEEKLKDYHQKPLKDRKATIVAQTLASHNFPTKRARELIKPSTDSASLRLEIEKKYFSAWILGSLCVTSQWEQVSAFLAPLPGPGCQPNANFLSLKVFFGLLNRKRAFKALNWLDSTSGDRKLKNPVLGKNLNFSKKVTLAASVQLWPLVVCSQIELDSYSNPLKTREVF